MRPTLVLRGRSSALGPLGSIRTVSLLVTVVLAQGVATTRVSACPRPTGKTGGLTGADRVNLGKNINHWANSCEGQISADGNTLYYNDDHFGLQGRMGTYRSRWLGTNWSDPELLQLGADMPSITRDENELFFTGALGEPPHWGVWRAERQRDGKFGAPIEVEFEGGTPPGTQTVAISPDGNRIVFVATGPGGKDLVMSTRNRSTELWSRPEQLGPPISGTGSEWHPFITYDGQRLIYSSSSPEVMGAHSGVHTFWGMLTMVANWNEARQNWDAPEPLGSFGCSPSLTEDGKHLYYGGRYPGGHGGLDMWTEKLGPVEKERVETYPQDVDRSSTNWCSLGRLPNATAASALVTTNDGSLVAMTEEGAIFRLDRGVSGSWHQVSPGPNACLTHVHEGRPPTALLRLTGDGILAATSAGVAKSTDGGQTWIDMELPDGVRGVRALVRSPGGVVFGGSKDGVIARSDDDGATWQVVSTIPLDVHALAVDAKNRVYATGAVRVSKTRPATAPFSTMRSDDEGVSFSNMEFDFHSDLNVGYSVYPASDESLYASIWVHAEREKTNIFRSTDGSLLTHTSKIPGNWWDDRAMSFIEASGAIYAGLSTNEASDLVFRSADKGETWASTGKLSPAREVFAMTLLDDGSLVAGTTPFAEVYRLLASSEDVCWPPIATPDPIGDTPPATQCACAHLRGGAGARQLACWGFLGAVGLVVARRRRGGHR